MSNHHHPTGTKRSERSVSNFLAFGGKIVSVLDCGIEDLLEVVEG
jgi:hypothetical protein